MAEDEGIQRLMAEIRQDPFLNPLDRPPAMNNTDCFAGKSENSFFGQPRGRVVHIAAHGIKRQGSKTQLKLWMNMITGVNYQIDRLKMLLQQLFRQSESGSQIMDMGIRKNSYFHHLPPLSPLHLANFRRLRPKSAIN